MNENSVIQKTNADFLKYIHHQNTSFLQVCLLQVRKTNLTGPVDHMDKQ